MSSVVRNQEQEVEILEKYKVRKQSHCYFRTQRYSKGMRGNSKGIFLVLTLWSRTSQAIRKKEEGKEEESKITISHFEAWREKSRRDGASACIFS